MNADEVKARLVGRWPDDQFLHVYEAPVDASRQGAKIDVLVFGLWRSKGWTVDAVEVKVSYSDWCREWRRTVNWLNRHDGPREWPRRPDQRTLDRWTCGTDECVAYDRIRARFNDPPVPEGFTATGSVTWRIDTSKNAPIRQHAHRFWIAAPVHLAQRIAADCEIVPACRTWGVIAVDTRGTGILRQPTTNPNPKPFAHPHWLGLLRTAADSGFQALQRAEQRGYTQGRRDALRLPAETPDGQEVTL